jgi:hypothetical protein
MTTFTGVLHPRPPWAAPAQVGRRGENHVLAHRVSESMTAMTRYAYLLPVVIVMLLVLLVTGCGDGKY